MGNLDKRNKRKENGLLKARRLSLGKPHVYWDRAYKEWLYCNQPTYEPVRSARDFCVEQDQRWTPVQKD